MKFHTYKEALIIFAKNPVKGKVKSRIASIIGEEKALELYKSLLIITHNNTKSINLDKYLFLTDYLDSELFDNNYKQIIQNGKDLGEKMKNAFEYVFRSGYEKVCIIGTDIPKLSANIINDAYKQLDKIHIVLGPALDGGYYMLGMKKVHDFLFDEVKWSADKVLSQTINKITLAGLTYSLLEELTDVDTLEDFNKLIDNQSNGS